MCVCVYACVSFSPIHSLSLGVYMYAHLLVRVPICSCARRFPRKFVVLKKTLLVRVPVCSCARPFPRILMSCPFRVCACVCVCVCMRAPLSLPFLSFCAPVYLRRILPAWFSTPRLSNFFIFSSPTLFFPVYSGRGPEEKKGGRGGEGEYPSISVSLTNTNTERKRERERERETHTHTHTHKCG